MVQRLNHILRIRLLTLTILLALLAIAENAGAQQPGLPHALRIVNYREDLMWGYAAPLSTIRFYYTDRGSFNRRPGTMPFHELTADEDGYWTYFIEFETSGRFTGPVIVSMTPAGGSEETFESPVLGPNEVFIVDPESCTDRKTLIMSPSYLNSPISWKDPAGNIVSQEPWIIDALPGTYTLSYTNIGGRTYSSAPLTFEGTPRPISAELNLDCGNSFIDYTGQYEGTGASFLWLNQASGSTVGTTRRVRLTAGKYNFYVSNNQGCRPAPATITVIGAQALATVDIRGKQVKNADCNESNGSITGIRVSPAGNNTPSYRWKDTKGNIFTTIDLYNLPPGKYTLEAYTAAGDCPTILTDVEVAEKNAITLDVTKQVATSTSCGLNNGSIIGLSTNATIYQWFKGEDRSTPVSTELDLRNAAPDFYTLTLRNQFGCRLEKVFHIVEGSPAVELTSIPVIKDDNCSLGNGSISGVTFNTSVSYIWRNAAGEELASNRDLVNVPAGNYTLTAKNDKCENTYSYIIGNSETIITSPVMDDILVCSASDVNVSFTAASDIYRIYNASGTLVAQSSSKDFKIRVDQPGVYYAALASGSCESSKTRFNIAFGASGLKIPNVFSPNGDGVNDKWIIKGLDVYTRPEVKLFNRQGQLVFHSIGHMDLFEGKSKGKELPVGVYYYIVSASPDCDPASGSLSLIR